jgi:hypothetical protein
VKRALGSVALGFVLAVIVVAVTDNASVPDGVRNVLSPGLFVASHVTVNGNLGEQISRFVAIIVCVDAAFYSAVVFIVATWFVRRRPRRVRMKSPYDP